MKTLPAYYVSWLRLIMLFDWQELVDIVIGSLAAAFSSMIESIKYGTIQGFSLCLWNIAHAVALWYTTILIERKQATFENGIRSYQIFSLTVPSITELWLIPTVISAISILIPAFQTLDRKTEIERTQLWMMSICYSLDYVFMLVCLMYLGCI